MGTDEKVAFVWKSGLATAWAVDPVEKCEKSEVS
jgi:hypothetical protein